MKKLSFLVVVFFVFLGLVGCGSSGVDEPGPEQGQNPPPGPFVGPSNPPPPVVIPPPPVEPPPPVDDPPPPPPPDPDPEPDPTPTKWALGVPEDTDIRLGQLTVGEAGVVYVNGTQHFAEDCGKICQTITSTGSLAKFSPDGKMLWRNDVAFNGGKLAIWGDALFVASADGGVASRYDATTGKNTGEDAWHQYVPQHCFHSAPPSGGLAVDATAIYFPQAGCLIGVLHDGTILGQANPNPVLSTEEGAGWINDVVVDKNGDIHLGVTTYAQITTKGAPHQGGSDAGLMKYPQVQELISTQWGGAGYEHMENMCDVGESIFALSGGAKLEVRKFDLQLKPVGDPIDVTAAHGGPNRTRIACDAVGGAVYLIGSNRDLEKFDLNLNSVWVAQTALNKSAEYLAVEVRQTDGVVFVLDGTKKVSLFSPTDGAPLN